MAGEPTQLSFATINLENLHLPDRVYYGNRSWTKPEYAAKVDWTAHALRRLDADVIGFQELWHRDALADVFTAAGLTDDYEVAAPKPIANRIANAVAVRKPHRLEQVEWVAAFPDRLRLRRRATRSLADTDYSMNVGIGEFSRPVVRATIQAAHRGPAPKVEVLVAHLKSKLPMNLEKEDEAALLPGDTDALGSALSTIRRTAEAAALRLLLNELLNTENAAVVLGDLNDGHRSVTTELISGPHRYRLFAKSAAGGQASRGLYATASLQQLRSLRDVYYTYIHEGAHESLDHILVSQHFYDYSSSRVWSFREMRLLNDDLDHPNRADLFASDHAPVVATFDYNTAK